MLTRLRRKGGGSKPTAGELMSEIEALSEQNRAAPHPDREHRIIHLRQLAGIARESEAGPRAEMVEPDFGALPDDMAQPEVSRDQLTPGLIRAAVLRHGALLVRGLVDTDQASTFAGEVERASAPGRRPTRGGPASWAISTPSSRRGR